MLKYDKFNNYGLKLPFAPSVRDHAGKTVPGTQIVDIRAQALRLSPEERVRMLSSPFSPGFSSGIWFFAEHSSRFHGSYKDPMSLEKKVDIACELARYGLKAIEAHHPWEINQDNLNL